MSEDHIPALEVPVLVPVMPDDEGRPTPAAPVLVPAPPPMPPVPPAPPIPPVMSLPPEPPVPPVSAAGREPEPMTVEMAATRAVRPSAVAPPKVPLAPMKRMQARFNPLADGMLYLVVFLGGFVGTAMRYGLNEIMPDALATQGVWSAFHPATFIANMIACLVFATLTAYLSQASWIRRRVRQLANRGLGMGMCGGFSTLSAMAIENLGALQHGEPVGFAVYTLASFAVGLVAAWSGATLGLEMAAKRAVRDLGSTAPVAAGGVAQDGASTVARSDGASHPLSSAVAIGGHDVGGVVASAAASTRVEQSEPVLAATTLVPSFEPDPVTDEIPLVADPLRGEARER